MRISRIGFIRCIGALVFLQMMQSGCGDSGDHVDYVALGASDALGIGAEPPSEGYVFRIEDGLDATDSCDGADLRNLGIPGAKIGDIENAALPVAKELDPDLITLWTGPNDVVGGESVETFEEKLANMLEELTSDTQAQIYMANIPNLTSLPEFIDDPDVDVTLERIQAFNAAITRQGAAFGVPVIDLFTQLPIDESLVSDDGFHPSSAGHERIAQLFLNQIIPGVCGVSQ